MPPKTAQAAALNHPTEMDIERNTIELLKYIGEDMARPGLRETPQRVRKAWEFWASGYKQSPQDVLKTFDAENCNELVFEGGIPFYSLCEHHLVHFFGVVHVGYIPGSKGIVGLSKFSRLVDVFSRRLQVQERLTNQIADAINEHLQPKAVGVVLRARHLCMESRGIQKAGMITYTHALRGVFMTEASARAEFLGVVERADSQCERL